MAADQARAGQAHRPAAAPESAPLWRLLQGTAQVVQAVRGGQSAAAALEQVEAALRPGVQSLSFQTLRQLGRA